MEPILYRNDGSEVILGMPVGNDAEGLEGIVYTAKGTDRLVKVFKQTVDRRLKERKINAMIRRPPLGSEQNKADGHVYIAWPIEPVYDAQGHFAGYTMPKIKSSRSLFLLKNPQKRRVSFPNADELLPYIAAANLATTVHNLHSAGYVIGDFSPNNFLVDDNGIVYTIDTDSFQMDNDGLTLPCEAGTPDYFPAEYLHDIDVGRPPQFTVSGDLFSLGKLLFQLLMNGFDAHTGRSANSRSAINMDQYCVKNSIYVYDNNCGFTPPKKAPSLTDTLSPELADAFRLCFTDGGRNSELRPSAKKWEELLDDYYMSVKNVTHIEMPSQDAIADTSIKRLPCVLCLDTSGSMIKDDAIGALNEGVAALINSLKLDRKAQMVVDLSVITFGGAPTVIKDFTPICDFSLPAIEAIDGFTPFYRALNLALDKIDERVSYCSQMGISLRPPLVIIMTDGQPLDMEAHDSTLKRVAYIKGTRTMDIVAVGIGNEYDDHLLDEICTDNWPRRMAFKQAPAPKAMAKKPLSFHKSAEDNSADKMPCRHVKLERNAQNFISFFKLISSNVAGGIR